MPTRRRHPRSLRQDIAASVDLPPSLVPSIARVFDAMESLGSSPRAIVSLLQRHAPPHPRRPLRVLDLACGKGDLAITLARRFAWRVLAVDACPDFITHAQARAARLGVDHLCDFRAAKITNTLRPRRGTLAHHTPFDLALMIGLWPTDRAAPLLSRLVRPRGLYLIDDAFAIHENAAERLNTPTLDLALAAIRARGDDVLHAAHTPLPSVRASNARILARLARNARALARQRPPLRPALAEFLDRQRHASRALERDLRPALVLARRS